MVSNHPVSFLAVLLLLSTQALAQQDMVSRKPPRGYGSIEPLLMSFEQAKADKQKDSRTDEPENLPGQSYREILRETIVYIDQDKRILRAEHVIMEALSDVGIDQIKELTFGFSKALHRPHIALAQTIQPDGSLVALRGSAAFIQTPQRWAQQSLFSDRSELRLVFPRIKRGSITESVVVFEEIERISEEIGHTERFWGNPASNRRRLVVDMPTTLVDQITTSERGLKRKAIKTTQDRTRWIWDEENREFPTPESNGPSIFSIVPQVRISSFRDWDHVATWYQQLLSGKTNHLPKGLHRASTRWIEPGATRQEIINTLLNKVANDIRYTGLEFGISALRPHSPKQVWQAGYGDCKDKSNLLRVLLKKYDIPAYLTLLSSRSFADIDRAAPHYGAFDHCILAVEDEDGELHFCDPTQANASLGSLPATNCGRDLLVINGNQAQWAKTPIPNQDFSRYDFNYIIESDESLSGRFNYRGRGPSVLSKIKTFSEGTSLEKRIAGAQFAAALFPHSQMPEIKVAQTNPTNQTLAFNGFVVRTNPRQVRSSLVGHQFDLRIPGLVNFAPPVPRSPTTDADRKSKYRQVGRRLVLNGKLKLPSGFIPNKIPAPHSVSTKWLQANAYWVYDGTANEVALTIKTTWLAGDVSPADFPAFAGIARQFADWLDQDLPIKRFKKEPVLSQISNPSSSDPLSNFQILADGDSQLALVDYRYPRDGDTQLRRMALQRTSELFPNDRITQFRCEREMAVLDLDEEQPAKVVQRLSNVLKEEKGRIPIPYYTEAEGVFAIAYGRLGHHEEAYQIFTRLCSEPSLQPELKEWLALNLAIQARKVGKHMQAWPIAEEAMLNRGQRWQVVFAEWAILGSETGQAHLVKKFLLKEAQNNAPSALRLCHLILQYVDQLDVDQPSEKAQIALSSVLLDLSTSRQTTDQFKQTLKQIIEQQGADAKQRQDAIDLITEIKAELPDRYAYYTTFVGEKNSLVAARGQIKEADRAGNFVQAARFAVGIFRDFTTDQIQTADITNAAIMLNWALDNGSDPSGEDLVDRLITFLQNEPSHTHHWYHAYYQKAKAALRRKQFETIDMVAEIAIGSQNDQWHSRFSMLIAQSLAEQGNYRSALDRYREIQVETWDHLTIRAFVDAMNISSRLRDTDATLHFVEHLRQVPTEHQTNPNYASIRDLLKISNTDLIAYWQARRQWWPQWVAFSQKLTVPLSADENRRLATLDEIRNLSDRSIPRSQEQLLHGLHSAAELSLWNPSMLSLFYPYGLDLYQAPVASIHRKQFRRLIIDAAKDIPLKENRTRYLGMAMSALFLAQNSALFTGTSLNDLTEAKEIVEDLLKETDLEAKHLIGLQPSVAFTKLIIAGKQSNYENNAIDYALNLLDKQSAFQGRNELLGSTLSLMKGNRQYHTRIAPLSERELLNPDTLRKSNLKKLLVEARDEFGAGSKLSESLRTFIQTWLDQYQPAWWDYASPNTWEQALQLISSIPATPAEPIPGLQRNHPYDRWTLNMNWEDSQATDLLIPRASRIKALYLYALSDEANGKDRKDAFNAAVLGWITLSLDNDDNPQATKQAIQSLLATNYLHPKQRLALQRALKRATSSSATEPQFNTLLARFPPTYQEPQPLSSEQTKQTLEQLLADGKIDYLEVDQFDQLRIDDLEKLRVLTRYYDRLKDAPVVPPVSAAKWRIKMARLQQKHSQKLTVWTEYQNDVSIAFPEKLELRPIEKLTAADLYLAKQWNELAKSVEIIRSGKFITSDQFFTRFAQQLHKTGQPKYINLSAQTYLKVAPYLNQQFAGINQVLDWSLPIQRQIFSNWLTNHPSHYSHTTELRRASQILAIKNGDTPQSVSLLSSKEKLSYLLGIGDKIGLSNETQRQSDAILFARSHILLTYHIYEFLDQKQKLELTREILKEMMPSLILETWSGDRNQHSSFLNLVQVMDSLELAPNHLPKAFRQQLPDPHNSEPIWQPGDAAYALAEWMAYHRNWQAVIHLSQQGHRAQPTQIKWISYLIRAYDALNDSEKLNELGAKYRASERGTIDYQHINLMLPKNDQ